MPILVELDSTVVFLLTAGEEQGLWGAEQHVERVLAEGRDVRAALNNAFAFGGQNASIAVKRYEGGAA